MGEDKSGKKEARPVLGDITNQLSKRGGSLASSSPKSSSKSVIGNKRPADTNSDDDSRFWKQVSKVVESLEKERFGSPKCPKIVSESGLSPLSGGKTYRLRTSSGGGSAVHGKAQSGVPSPARDAKEPSRSGSDRLDLGKSQTLPNVVALGDTIKESTPQVTVVESSKSSQRNCLESRKEDCQGEETVVISDSGENECTQESLTTKVVRDEAKTLDFDYMPSSQSESVVNSRLMESQDKGLYGLERCMLLKGDGCSSSATGLDLLKSCSCSFCTKAAYIWSDLHYQDVKGRISVLSKSQKEANNLAQRYPGESEKARNSQQHPMRAANLENDLTSQWNSLFQHMENMFASENGQLQTYLLNLKDLREGFKNSESANGSSDGQQCSSDASDQ